MGSRSCELDALRLMVPRLPFLTSIIAMLCVVPFLCATIGCKSSNPYRLVSEKYGFSVEFPEKPTEQTSINDEGLPKSSWQVSHEKIVAKDY
jgi:hypothetical protein